MEKEQLRPIALTKPLRCIVKFGGAAITCKNELEKINQEDLKTVSKQLKDAIGSGNNFVGMDWSRRSGKPSDEILFDVDEIRNDDSVLESDSFIVVHGAGSFGHFQASKSGVHKGGLNQSLVKAGFVATRISVTSLNLEIVRVLAREGIPSVGMSPFSCGWSTSKRNITSADVSAVAKAIDSGFVPVMHGDAVFDHLLDCTILSGDVIIRHLAEALRPEYVVFLVSFRIDQITSMICFLKTDVFGVYDRPPTEPEAILLREIAVNEDGTWSVVNPSLSNSVEVTVAAHDTTGGMMTKISEAAAIAKLGIDVYIVKAATDHSLKALSGKLPDQLPDDWLGTAIRFSTFLI